MPAFKKTISGLALAATIGVAGCTNDNSQSAPPVEDPFPEPVLHYNFTDNPDIIEGENFSLIYDAVELRGDGYIKIPAETISNIDDAITVSMWVRLNVNHLWTNLFSIGNKKDSYVVAATQGENQKTELFGVTLAAKDSGEEQRIKADGFNQVPLNQWSHIAYTQTDNEAKLYLDGSEVASGEISYRLSAIAAQSDTVYFGAPSVWPDPGINGLMDDIRIYDLELTQEQVLKEFENGRSGEDDIDVTPGTTFTNPIVPVGGHAGSADPSVWYRDGYYYYVKSVDDLRIKVAKAERLQDIGIAPRITVFDPPEDTMYSEQIWAPEIQYIQDKWYIYFAASDGANENHRMYVLESKTQDPQGEYEFKGQITDPSDKWAIDGMAFENNDELYFVWSGWEGDADVRQELYIASMSDPWTINSDRVEISKPEYNWEAHINEGPQVLQKDGRTFIIYSANKSWTDNYQLGMLEYKGGDMLDADSWYKHKNPVFSKGHSAYGTGHNGFTVSPDGTESWLLYHAMRRSGGGWGDRSVRAQRFYWNDDGTPDFGIPVDYSAPVAVPSGTPDVTLYKYEAEDAVLGGGAKIIIDLNASSDKTVGMIDVPDIDYVLFEVDVEEAGNYRLTVMGSNGTDDVSDHDVFVNDNIVEPVSHINLGWKAYNPTHGEIQLSKGMNTIKLTARNGFAQIDFIALNLID